MFLKIRDVEHGACAILTHRSEFGVESRLAKIDSGDNSTTGRKPSMYIKRHLNRSVLDNLFVTNVDLDHISDLNNLWREGIPVSTFIRNRSVSPEVMKINKEVSGNLTDDIQRYLDFHASYAYPVNTLFDQNMGGITARTFWNSTPHFYDTNNLGLVAFFKFGAFKVLLPGDLENDGWLALLEQPTFCADLADTTVPVASHHRRENRYCQVLFNYCHPRAIVMSDKAIVHDTQGMSQTYRQRVVDNWPNGNLVATTGKQRRDGWIQFNVNDRGGFTVHTECYR